jgi:hypothetical protein
VPRSLEVQDVIARDAATPLRHDEPFVKSRMSLGTPSTGPILSVSRKPKGSQGEVSGAKPEGRAGYASTLLLTAAAALGSTHDLLEAAVPSHLRGVKDDQGKVRIVERSAR